MLKKTAGILLLVSGSAFASDATLGFNKLSASYIDSDSNGSSENGYGVDLSFALTKNIFATFDYSTRSFGSSDREFFSGGIGGNYALTEDDNIVVFGSVTWEQFEIKGSGAESSPDEPTSDEPACDPLAFDLASLAACGGSIFPAPQSQAGTASKAHIAGHIDSFRTDGYGALVGIRAFVINNLEVNASYTYRDYSDLDDAESIMSLGTAYHLGSWIFSLAYDNYDEFDIDEFIAGVSYTFGKSADGEEASIW